MRYNLDADILDHSGDKVGELQHVVVDPITNEITHLVVRKGWLFKQDKVLPESLVGQTDEEGIHLYQFDGSLGDMPDYEETHFLPYNYVDNEDDDSTQVINTVMMYPPVGRPYGTFPIFPQEFQTQVVEKNIPKAAIAIQEGATLVDMEGEELGEITEVIATATADRVTDIVFKDTDGNMKRIPIHWVQDMFENSVRLAISEEMLNNVPEHRIAEPTA